MKEYIYKNRGMHLERMINDSNTFYLNKDRGIIYKKPTPIKVLNVSYPSRRETIINKAVFEGISTLDYNGIYKGRYIEFDAKETKSKTSFPLANIKDHQINHIKNILRHNGIIFLIISMNNNFYLLDGNKLLEFIKLNNRKSIPFEFIDNLPKIKERYIPRLDYLKTVDELYFKGEKIYEEVKS